MKTWPVLPLVFLSVKLHSHAFSTLTESPHRLCLATLVREPTTVKHTSSCHAADNGGSDITYGTYMSDLAVQHTIMQSVPVIGWDTAAAQQLHRSIRKKLKNELNREHIEHNIRYYTIPVTGTRVHYYEIKTDSIDRTQRRMPATHYVCPLGRQCVEPQICDNKTKMHKHLQSKHNIKQEFTCVMCLKYCGHSQHSLSTHQRFCAAELSQAVTALKQTDVLADDIILNYMSCVIDKVWCKCHHGAQHGNQSSVVSVDVCVMRLMYVCATIRWNQY